MRPLSGFFRVLLCASTAWSALAMAATWQPLRDFDYGSTAIDRDMQIRQGDQIQAWLLINYKTPQNMSGVRGNEFLSRKEYVRVDCTKNQLGLIMIADHAAARGEGRLVFQSSANDFPRMDPAVPGTLEEAVVLNLCARRGGAQAAGAGAQAAPGGAQQQGQ